MKHLFLKFIAFLIVLITITSCGKNQRPIDDNSTSLPDSKNEQSISPSAATQANTTDETSESTSRTQEQTTAAATSAPPTTTSTASESTTITQEETTAAATSVPPTTTSTASESTTKTQKQTAAPTTAPASDDKPEAQSKATDSPAGDSPAADILGANSFFTLPDGRTINISDIERVLLNSNSTNEPFPTVTEVTDIDDIIRVLSAFNSMEFGEPYAGGWVGGNSINIYSGGKSFSQIAFKDDEIYLVELIAEENAKAVYPIISGGLSYEEWKSLFTVNE